MADRSVSIRMGTTGKQDVTRAFDEIALSGDASAKRLSRSYEQAGEDVAEAMRRQADAAAKIAAIMPQSAVQMRINDANGTGFGQWEGSARQSAATFKELLAAEEALERKALSLKLAIDPAFAAQQRFNAEMADARTLIAAGSITLDEYCAKLRQEQAALDAVGATGRRTGSAFAAAAPQIQDLFTQISMGGNPLNALAVQGGQLAGQLQYVGGKAQAVADIFMSPWGVAFQVALLVLSPFVSKLWEESEAQKAAEKATEEHRKAMLSLADAQGKAIQTAERKQALDVAAIKNELDAAIATRTRLKAVLELAAAQEKAAGQVSYGAAGGAGAYGAQQYFSGRIADLRRQQDDNDEIIAKLQKGFGEGFARMVGQRVDALSTPEGAIRARYDRERAAAMATLPGTENAGALGARLRELNAARDAELKAIKDSTEARKRDADTLSPGQVAKMLRDALPGVHVTSTTRTAEHNREIGGAKNSYHVRGQALDFVPAGGMSSMTKADVRALFESRGIDVVELLGPGDKGHSDHFHVAWTKGKMALDEFTDAAKRAKVAGEETQKLLSWANGLGIKDSWIDDLWSAQERRQAEMQRAAKAIFGEQDPFAEGERQTDAANEQAKVSSAVLSEEVEKREQGIRSAASLYRDLFSGGVDSITQRFRERMMDALADLLAKWTVGNAQGGGSFLSSLTRLFSTGSDAIGSSIADQASATAEAANQAASANFRMFASGTEYAPGGMALLGEGGPEVAWLPRGSRVAPASETRRLFAANDRGGDTHVHVYANDAVLADTVRGWVSEGVGVAATRGAAGGAALSQAEGQRSAARRLGRFR